MEQLTERQKLVLALMEREKAKTGFEPSLSDLARKLKINTNGVAGHLKALEKKGYLKRHAARKGVLQLTNSSVEEQFFEVPFLGSIAAGHVQEVLESPGEAVHLSRESFGKSVFALKVHGHSMLGDGIMPGDFALISLAKKEFHKQRIFAVRVKGEVTLKRLEKAKDSPGYFNLIPSNKDFPIKSFAAKDIEIVGEMVGLIRRWIS